jgi:hypothetical protein
MRKGSHKTDFIPVGNIVNLKTSPHELAPIAYKPEQVRIVELLDILTRLCDACHEMDNKTEPWSTIRKDIERLR